MTSIFEYNRTGEIAELVIRGALNEKLDTFKWNINDKKTENKIFQFLKRKYGMFKNIKDIDSDLEWLKKY